MNSDRVQFETIAILRGYAQAILAYNPEDLRPSTANMIWKHVVDMHNVAQRLDIQS